MDSILSNNFIEAVKSCQKTIFLASIVSITLFSLAIAIDFENINVPGLGVKFGGKAALGMLFTVFISLGAYLTIQLSRVKSNLDSISCTNIKESLLKYPSVVCGHITLRIVFIALPSTLLFIAMYTAFKGEILLTCFFVTLCSVPYFFAASVAFSTKT
jgi:hypothetical protein